MQRNKEIVKISIYGILVNLVLVGFKAVVGLIANSISIILDAVNNLTDVLSSVVTIAGLRLATKRPDRKHPFGYGRVEYFSAIVISLIVVSAGVASLVESIKKIIEPTTPSYSSITLVVIIVAIVVKIVLGTFVKREGTKLKSDALIASGADALFDAVVNISEIK